MFRWVQGLDSSKQLPFRQGLVFLLSRGARLVWAFGHHAPWTVLLPVQGQVLPLYGPLVIFCILECLLGP